MRKRAATSYTIIRTSSFSHKNFDKPLGKDQLLLCEWLYIILATQQHILRWFLSIVS